MRFNGFGKKHFLGNKAIKQRNAGHRCAGNHCQRCRIGHSSRQAAKLPHIARAGFMIDNASRHEERCFKDRMVDHVEDRSHSSKWTTKAQKRCNETKIADGRIGKQAFEILLKYSEEARDQQRGQACETKYPKPFFSASKNRPQARKQEYTCFHHCCGMQIGRNWRWGGHRIWQPEMERELRAFCEYGQKNENKRYNVKRVRANDISGFKNLVEIVASNDVTQ